MSINRPALSIIAGAALLCCALAARPAVASPARNAAAAARRRATGAAAVGRPDARRRSRSSIWTRARARWPPHRVPGVAQRRCPTLGTTTSRRPRPRRCPEPRTACCRSGRRTGAGRLLCRWPHESAVAPERRSRGPRGGASAARRRVASEWRHHLRAAHATAACSAGALRTAASKPLTTLDAGAGESSHRFPALADAAGTSSSSSAPTQPTRRGIWIAPLDRPDARTRLSGGDTSAIAAGDCDPVRGRRGAARPAAERPRARRDAGARRAAGARSAPPSVTARRTSSPRRVGGDALVYGAPQPHAARAALARSTRPSRGTLGERNGGVGRADRARRRTRRRDAARSAARARSTSGPTTANGRCRVASRRRSTSTSRRCGRATARASPGSAGGARLRARRAGGAAGAIAAQVRAPVRVWDWSPDGRWIVVSEARPDTQGGPAGCCRREPAPTSRGRTPVAVQRDAGRRSRRTGAGWRMPRTSPASSRSTSIRFPSPGIARA